MEKIADPHGMLLWREKIPADWLPKVRANLGEVLVDHAHLERKAATTAINLEKYVELHPSVSELNAIAIEELQHFEQVLVLLRERGIPFKSPQKSIWITGMMQQIRKGRQHQVIDHLVVCALIEGRSCEKFQILAESVRMTRDPKNPPGCMLSTAVLTCAPENRPAAEAAAAYRAASLAMLEGRFREAREAGELPASVEPLALARFYGAIMQGIAIQAIDGADEAAVQSIVEIALAAWPG